MGGGLICTEGGKVVAPADLSRGPSAAAPSLSSPFLPEILTSFFPPPPIESPFGPSLRALPLPRALCMLHTQS